MTLHPRFTTFAALAAGLLTFTTASGAAAETAPTVATAPAQAPPAVPPTGMGVTCVKGPNDNTEAADCPVLKWHGYTYWAYSYYDNRMAMGIVAYDAGGKVVAQWELPGARYVHAITVDSGARTITFAGQAGNKITTGWDSLLPPPVVVQIAPYNAPAVPAGMKVSCSKSASDWSAAATCPVLKWGDYTYWAYSYVDNRVGMAIVAYDASNKQVKLWEKSGARYVYGITVDKTARTVTFAGQTDLKIAFNWNDLLVSSVVTNWSKKTTPAGVTFKQVSVGSAQHVWAVDTAGSPWRWNGSIFEKKNGTVASLSVGADGVVWGLTANDDIYTYQGPDWTKQPGTLRSIATAGGNVVWGVQSDGDTFRWDPSIKNWLKVSTPAGVTFKQISVGSAQHVWAVDTAGSPWRWNGSIFEKKNGTVASLSVGADGVVWGLTSIDEIWVYQGPDWTKRPGTLRSISSAGGDVAWGVQSNGGTFRLGY